MKKIYIARFDSGKDLYEVAHSSPIQAEKLLRSHLASLAHKGKLRFDEDELEQEFEENLVIFEYEIGQLTIV